MFKEWYMTVQYKFSSMVETHQNKPGTLIQILSIETIKMI